MISVIVSLLVFLIVLSLVYWIITQLPLPAPIAQIANIIVVVLAALWLIYFLMGLPHGLAWR